MLSLGHQFLLIFFLAEYKDNLFHYYHLVEKKVQSTAISNLFRYHSLDGYPVAPETTLYTVIRLRTAFILFGAMYVVYGLILLLIKRKINRNFRSASLGEKLQHILDALNTPETFDDFDTDLSLDLNGHWEKWWSVLLEMGVMILMQFITNIALLLPIFITGIFFLLTY